MTNSTEREAFEAWVRQFFADVEDIDMSWSERFDVFRNTNVHGFWCCWREARAALLAELAQQEPVAWINLGPVVGFSEDVEKLQWLQEGVNSTPLIPRPEPTK